jgi:cytochrome c553
MPVHLNCERLLRPIVAAVALWGAGAAAVSGGAGAHADTTDAGFPPRLSETDLFIAGTREPRVGVLGFSPQYPLWSDAADKRRWIALPPGRSIDASRPDAWAFPRGTRLWKEFAHAGRAVETRLIERRADGRWHFASYVWRADGTDADLAPAAGVRALDIAAAPGGRYAVPARADCRTCHDGAPVPVLGFSALQLSGDRDPLAPHADADAAAVDLRALAGRGLLRNLPPALLKQPPRIAARTPDERAALGYLHGNCGHCHNDDGESAPVPLALAQRVAAGRADGAHVQRTLRALPRIRWPGSAETLPIVSPGRAEASVLALRMASRDPRLQMPPLGTVVPDHDALALVERWITTTHRPQEKKP